jgi:hypothetical protein
MWTDLRAALPVLQYTDEVKLTYLILQHCINIP